MWKKNFLSVTQEWLKILIQYKTYRMEMFQLSEENCLV